jgi:hypothetical protein
MAREFKIIKYALVIVTFYVLIIATFNTINTWGKPVTNSTYAIKRQVVDEIYKDAKGKPFVFFAYDSAIYTFDYDYLFQWLGHTKYNLMPSREIVSNEPIYIVLPSGSKEAGVSFVNYKTPNKSYQTAKNWKESDGTQVLKRVLK